jgi:hypothetical protein
MIEDIMNGEDTYSARSDMSIREMAYRTDPANASLPIIKLKFKPLDNPKQLLTVLQGILVIKHRELSVTTLLPDLYNISTGADA